jgi:hypothetical protein
MFFCFDLLLSSLFISLLPGALLWGSDGALESGQGTEKVVLGVYLIGFGLRERSLRIIYIKLGTDPGLKSNIGEPERLAIMTESLSVLTLQGVELTLFGDAQAKSFHG